MGNFSHPSRTHDRGGGANRSFPATKMQQFFPSEQNSRSKLLAVDNVHNSSGERANQSLQSQHGGYFLLAAILLGEQNFRCGEQILARE